MVYKPGLHTIATLIDCNKELLAGYAALKEYIDHLIQLYNLQKLGDVYHQFQGGGFTAVVCLSESHLSVHTWPEFNLANIDIYLSNHLKENDNLVALLLEKIVGFLSATVKEQHNIIR